MSLFGRHLLEVPAVLGYNKKRPRSVFASAARPHNRPKFTASNGRKRSYLPRQATACVWPGLSPVFRFQLEEKPHDHDE